MIELPKRVVKFDKEYQRIEESLKRCIKTWKFRYLYLMVLSQYTGRMKNGDIQYILCNTQKFSELLLQPIIL